MTRHATNTPPDVSGHAPAVSAPQTGNGKAEPAWLEPDRVTLVIPGQPVSGKNHTRPRFRGGKFAGIAKSKAAEDWAARVIPEIARQFARYGRPTLKVPVAVGLVLHCKHPATSSANPDGDNAQSAVWDALVKAHVLADDRLIAYWWGGRQHDPRDPRIEVTITILTPGSLTCEDPNTTRRVA